MSGTYALVAVLVAAALAFLTWHGARVWADQGRIAGPPGGLSQVARRLGRSAWGALLPGRYWWGTRLEALSPAEQQALLACETEALGLSRAAAERCPLCGTEIPRAWTLDGEGKATVAPGPVECPVCDFRLDSCRHCRHFRPGGPRHTFQPGILDADFTSGRCGFYKRSQPVEQAAAPHMAEALKQRGYDRIRAPMPIKDSMLRPDSCRAFDPHPRRVEASDVTWPGPRRIALLRLSGAGTRPDRPDRRETAVDEQQWLL